MTQQQEVEIRDMRRGGWFWVDNDLVRRDGAILGVYGIAVYAALCTFGNATGNTEVSIPTIARTIGCSEGKVREALEQLEAMGWIRREARTRQLDNGQVVHLPYLITLLNKPAGPAQQQAVPKPEPQDLQAQAMQVETNKTVVVNIHTINGQRPEFDMYIGRAARGFKASEWQNPFREGVDGDRSEVVAKYRDYLLKSRPDLLQKIPDLVGKRLGCWCAPEPCHGDVLVELVEAYQAGTWQPPDPKTFTPYDAPALLSVAEIKALKLTRQQWQTLLENEQRGKQRTSVIVFCQAKVNAHPLEPRFDEMMKAVDACTVQSIDDPGMAATFAKVIRTQLWSSAEHYYTPEDLLEFAKSGRKVENVYWLAGELSRWRNEQKAKQQQGATNNGREKDQSVDDAMEALYRKLGRTTGPARPALKQQADV